MCDLLACHAPPEGSAISVCIGGLICAPPLASSHSLTSRSTPLSMDYIRLKHEVGELQKQVTEWQRKVQVKML